MEITDSESVVHVSNDEEIEAALAKRYENDANEFWIYEEGIEFPALAIMVRDAVACVQYFPEEDHAGFISIGDKAAQGISIFFVNGGEEQEISNEMIVPVSVAIKASKEFLISQGLPKSINWMALSE